MCPCMTCQPPKARTMAETRSETKNSGAAVSVVDKPSSACADVAVRALASAMRAKRSFSRPADFTVSIAVRPAESVPAPRPMSFSSVRVRSTSARPDRITIRMTAAMMPVAIRARCLSMTNSAMMNSVDVSSPTSAGAIFDANASANSSTASRRCTMSPV